MTLPTFLEPANARITIPVALAVGYACYHWWRWRMMHPKIVIEDLPEPASEAQTVAKLEPSKPKDVNVPKPEQGKAPERNRPPVPQPEPAHHAEEHKAEASHGASRWQARREREKAEAKLNFKAFDPESHERAYRKARDGRPEYFVRLGEYAWRRGAMTETHFWVSMAKFHGVEGLDEWLKEIRRRWIQTGRPMEWHNVYEQYPFERGALARAYLMLVSGFSVSVSRNRVVRMANDGNADARMILDNLQ